MAKKQKKYVVSLSPAGLELLMIVLRLDPIPGSIVSLGDDKYEMSASFYELVEKYGIV